MRNSTRYFTSGGCVGFKNNLLGERPVSSWSSTYVRRCLGVMIYCTSCLSYLRELFFTKCLSVLFRHLQPQESWSQLQPYLRVWPYCCIDVVATTLWDECTPNPLGWIAYQLHRVSCKPDRFDWKLKTCVAHMYSRFRDSCIAKSPGLSDCHNSN